MKLVNVSCLSSCILAVLSIGKVDAAKLLSEPTNGEKFDPNADTEQHDPTADNEQLDPTEQTKTTDIIGIILMK